MSEINRDPVDLDDPNIYDSEAIEELALVGEVDATVWARHFVAAVIRTPDIATDEATMVAWFAVAIMSGYDHGEAIGVDSAPSERAER